MAQLVVRNLEDDVKARLKERARRHGHSLESEVRDILRSVVNEKPETERGLGTQIAELFRDCGFEEGEIEELRGYTIEPPSFDP